MGTALQIETEKKEKNSTVLFFFFFICFKFSVQQQPTVVHLCQVEDKHANRGFVEKTHFEKREKEKKKKEVPWLISIFPYLWCGCS